MGGKGQTKMGLRKTWFTIILLLVIAVLTAFTFFLMPFARTAPFVASDYQYGLDYAVELQDIPIAAQETGYTCYAVSMVLVKSYLGFETAEHDMRSELGLLERTEGMLPKEYLACANQVFEPLSYSVSLVNPASQAEILNVISGSLENGLPAVIFYSAKDDWNKPHYNTHYAMVYGIDMKKETVRTSNPYGYLEELSFTELYDGLDFTNYEAEPLLFRMGRKAGVVNNNNIFVWESIS